MPEDALPDPPDVAVPEIPTRPAAPPRAYESMPDDDPAHAASNDGDGTQAS